MVVVLGEEDGVTTEVATRDGLADAEATEDLEGPHGGSGDLLVGEVGDLGAGNHARLLLGGGVGRGHRGRLAVPELEAAAPDLLKEAIKENKKCIKCGIMRKSDMARLGEG